MSTDRTRRLAAAGAVLGLALTACGGGGGSAPGGDRSPAAVTSQSTGSGGSSAAGAARTSRGVPKSLRPADFGDPTGVTNQWLPLEPGLQWVRQGRTDVGHRPIPHRVVSTVTDVSRTIAGVRTIAVLDQDIDAGQVAQESLDYFAVDSKGNVWDLGGYTEQYEGGRFVSAQDAWLAGVGGAQAGVLMPADPRRGPQWSIAKPPGEDGDAAEVVRRGMHKCVPFGCFDHVLVVREGKASALDNEFKFYAPGLGQILNTPRSMSAHHDVEALQNATRLSAKGLAEMSNEALRLDRHAATVKPAVFGTGRATRMAG